MLTIRKQISYKTIDIITTLYLGPVAPWPMLEILSLRDRRRK